MSSPRTEEETLAALQALVGKYIRIEYEDGKGGAGVLVAVTRNAQGVIELELDYGYSFYLLPGTLVREVEECEGR